jgi:DTW domain-containing protein YfiP
MRSSLRAPARRRGSPEYTFPGEAGAARRRVAPGLEAWAGCPLPSAPVREICRRCLRPAGFCLCEALPPIPSRTRVVILQHPREARLAICTAWLTRLALPSSELHRGVRFDGDARVREVLADPGAALLFPGDGAVPAVARAEDPPRLLVTVDGTWPQASKMLQANPALARLPRISVEPDRRGGYAGLRREPEPHCLSTLEAVALALGALERDPQRFEPMRKAFRRMVEQQLACAQGARRSPRHRRARGGAQTDEA